MKRDEKGRFTTSKQESKTTEEKVYATGFKGFEKGMICREKQYAENTVFEEPEAKLCERGMHFCENPLAVFGYYPPCDNHEYARVDSLAPCKTEDDKSCTTKLRINAKISLAGLCSAAVDFVLSKIDKKKKQQVMDSAATNTGNKSAATNTGDYSAATNTGNKSAATNTGFQSAATNTGFQSAATNTGNKSAATNTGFQSAATNTGDYSAATNTGDYSAATNTGNKSAATNTGFQSAATNTGDHSAATNTGFQSAATNTGFQSAATNTGNKSAATNTGFQSAATNTGDQSAASVEGKESFAISTGIQSKVKGSLGCFIACAEWKQYENGEWHPVAFVSAKVDGKNIKADTWYTVKNGKFVKAE